VFLVDGCRTPFARSQTLFARLSAYELARAAVAGLLHRIGFSHSIDLIVLGTVLQDPAVSNLAREVGLAAGLADSTPGWTVTAACASSNVAAASAVTAIGAGLARLVIAGGAEFLSDPPIRVRRRLRRRLVAAQRARGMRDYLRLLRGLRPADLLPEVPAIAEHSTGLTMGQNAERMAKRFGISRTDQDAFALRSHQRAAAAAAAGRLDDQITIVYPPPDWQPVAQDNGVRSDSAIEKLASLAPAFDRVFGTVTAGNSSYLTDGAAVCLLASEGAVEKLGLAPLAAVRAMSLTAADPLEELLLGPVFSIPEALERAGIALDDVGVVELHEAFAAQALACVKLLADPDFCRDRLNRDEPVGIVDPERLNGWGGSLSIGHPFGATGVRLLITCARRMQAENARYGLVATCAAGAIGNAFVLEAV
jgi:acetyl-CoA acyltransferase